MTVRAKVRRCRNTVVVRPASGLGCRASCRCLFENFVNHSIARQTFCCSGAGCLKLTDPARFPALGWHHVDASVYDGAGCGSDLLETCMSGRSGDKAWLYDTESVRWWWKKVVSPDGLAPRYWEVSTNSWYTVSVISCQRNLRLAVPTSIVWRNGHLFDRELPCNSRYPGCDPGLLRSICRRS